MNSRNNFDIIRLLLAFIVMLVHTSVATQNKQLSIFAQLLNSDFAVKAFFAISGFLITNSYLTSSSLSMYFIKRAQRILPAYFFTILFCFFIGVFLTHLPLIAFLQSKETIRYLTANFIFLNFLQPTLPGVFVNNPLQTMNGSLWSIKNELILYLLLPLILSMMKKHPLKTWILIFIISCLWFYYFTYYYQGVRAYSLSKQFISLSSYFFFGALLVIYQPLRIKLKEIAIISLVIYLFLKNTKYDFLIDPIAFSSVILLFCTNLFTKIKIRQFGDLSYGIYLYHFPIVQIIQHYNFFDSFPWLSLLMVVILTLTLSYASWHLLERHFLRSGNKRQLVIS